MLAQLTFSSLLGPPTASPLLLVSAEAQWTSVMPRPKDLMLPILFPPIPLVTHPCHPWTQDTCLLHTFQALAMRHQASSARPVINIIHYIVVNQLQHFLLLLRPNLFLNADRNLQNSLRGKRIQMPFITQTSRYFLKYCDWGHMMWMLVC